MPATGHRRCTAAFGRTIVLLSGVLLVANGATAGEPSAVDSPLSVDESLERFELHPDLRIELVAAEPQVVDPVALAFDAEGRLWVAEMRDYPNGPQDGDPPQSRIRRLEDRDGDGRFETATVFANGLLFANGIQPWRDGVIVTRSGEVAYLQDTDGDGKADTQETWFTGFAEQNPQLRANHPTFAFDNHIYVANGLRGGDVIARRPEWRDGAEPVSISGMDFRFHPLEGAYEAVSGVGQFGMTFDDFGNRFVCSNRNPCRHIVLEDRYLARNPHLAVGGVAHDVSPPGAASRVFPLSEAWTTSNLHAGQFTAACGVTIYRGNALPDKFRGNSFTCEPTGNLVHRDVLQPDGATFTSHYGREDVEFLASPDTWFRPVNLAHGPDGALYVIDMYRAVIEHPQFMPDELKQRPDLRHGDDRGRIYRILPKDEQTGNDHDAAALAHRSTSELVALLTHPNVWQRETAARLVFQRQDDAVADELVNLLRSGDAPQARMHALWALAGLDGLTTETVKTALDDPHPRVREHAVRLAEPWVEDDTELHRKVLALGESEDARLRFQVALSLGEAAITDSALEMLASIALQGADDRWTRAAVLTAVPERAVALLESALGRIARRKQTDEGAVALVREIAEVVGARRQTDEIETALAALDAVAEGTEESSRNNGRRIRFALLDGLGDGLRRRGESLAAHIGKFSGPQQSRVSSLFDEAAQTALSGEAASEARMNAVSVLGHAPYQKSAQALKKLARDETSQSLRLAAIGTLARYGKPEVAEMLLVDFTSRTPAVRRAILDALLSRTAFTRLLLERIEAGRFSVSELGPGHVRRLTRHRNKQLRQQAKELLAEAVPEKRRQVLAKYQKALELAGNAERGREVFRENCTGCHRIAGMGVDVAPDISDSRTKKPAELLTSILDPNRAIDNNYISYSVITTDGKVHTGIIASETASSISLKQEEGKTVTLLRDEVAQIRSGGVSLMPVGLEKKISVQQMADLISFIKNWRYLESDIPVRAGPSRK